MLIITSLVITIFGGCKKEETNSEKSQELILKQINRFIPNADAKSKVKMLNNFRNKVALVKSDQLKSTINFADMTADSARWLLETALNTDYANIYDSTLKNFSRNTFEFEVLNSGITADGYPIIRGESLAVKYSFLEEAVNQLNSDTTTFYLASIQFVSFNSEKSTLSANYISAMGPSNHPWAHMPIVLHPDETAVDFLPGEEYYPYPHYPYPFSPTNQNPDWAGAKIEAKLNAHPQEMYALPFGYIIERVQPDLWADFTDYPTGNNLLYHSDEATVKLNYIQLNSCLHNYESILDSWNPFGTNNIYVAHFFVGYTDTNYMWEPPLSYQGFLGYHRWHTVWAEKIILTPDPGYGSEE